MMEWMFSLAIVPVLLCVLFMCVLPMALAALGLRRRAPRDEPAATAQHAEHVDAAAR